MIVVAGFWEFGWFAPINEQNTWLMIKREFNIDRLAMIPVSGIDTSKIDEYKDVQSLLQTYPDLIPVFLDEKGETSLREFKHPENVLYIAGKVGYSPFINMGENYQSIKVETSTNKGLLWGHQIMTLILYDRMIKKWQ